MYPEKVPLAINRTYCQLLLFLRHILFCRVSKIGFGVDTKQLNFTLFSVGMELLQKILKITFRFHVGLRRRVSNRISKIQVEQATHVISDKKFSVLACLLKSLYGSFDYPLLIELFYFFFFWQGTKTVNPLCIAMNEFLDDFQTFGRPVVP